MEFLLEFATVSIETSAQALLILEVLEGSHVEKFLNSVVPIADKCRESHQLLVPLPPVLKLGHTDPKLLTPGLRFSLAFYHASGTKTQQEL